MSGAGIFGELSFDAREGFDCATLSVKIEDSWT
jgi:hypothetical protein